jgi:hypothetical protein
MYGEIKKFRRDLGVGVIRAEDGRSYRFQGEEIRNRFEDLEGSRLETSSCWPARRGRPSAASASDRRSGSDCAMTNNLNLADVPAVEVSEIGFVIELLIASGKGLALLRGLTEDEIRAIEERIWAEFEGSSQARLAVALRFRALLDVFASRRLKALFLERGFKLLTAVTREAATRRLNIRFGFNPQRLLLALDAATANPRPAVYAKEPMPIAA